nr:PREDICTED: probable ergosterol biosynthetic protein 28 [Bos mutus]
MSRFLNMLCSWLMMISIIAVGHSLQSFQDHTFLYENIYTGKPDLVNGLQARTFGVWTLLSSVVRCLCAIDIHNKTSSHISLSHRQILVPVGQKPQEGEGEEDSKSSKAPTTVQKEHF